MTTRPPTPRDASLPSLAWTRTDILGLFVVSALALAAARWLWLPGLPNKNDMLQSIQRIAELQDAWREGLYYPRIGPNLMYGYGALLFNFYPPLVSFAGLVLRSLGLGWIETGKALITLELVLGGVGVYVYARRLLGTRLAATVAGALYALAPYLLLVHYERGALAEGMALALLPWLFWSAHSLYASGTHSRRDLIITAMLVAAMMLAHNITALFVVPGVALYLVILAALERRLRALIPAAAAFALGLALAAFYWLPALGEIDQTRASETMLRGSAALYRALIPLQAIYQRTPRVEYAGDWRFRLALWPFVIGVLGTAALFLPGKRPRAPLALLAVALWLIVLLQAPFSQVIWESISVIRYVQFSWRLFGPAAFCIALLGGSLFTLPRFGGRIGWVIAAVALAGIFVMSTANLRPERLPNWVQVDDSSITREAMWERGRNGYPLFQDYMPVGQRLGSAGLAQARSGNKKTLLPATPLPEHLALVEHSPLRYVLDVHAGQPWTLRLNQLFFPGWRVAVDGAPVPTSASGLAGVVTAELPAGTYRVTAWFGDTPLRAAAAAISLLALGLWLALLLPLRRWWTVTLAALALALLLRALIAVAQGPLRPVERPTAYRAQFDDGVRLLAYSVPEQSVCAGDSLQMHLYWQVDHTPARDDKLFLHLTPLDDSGVVAQHDSTTFSGFSPMTVWEPGEIVRDEQTLAIDASVAPGRYRLLAGLYDPDTVQNLRVLDAPTVLPGDRLLLTEIDVCPSDFAP